MLRVLTLSTLFPDASRPDFGIFVERQTLALTERAGVQVRVVAPLGIPPWPLSRLSRYQALDAQPRHERWKGLRVDRPRFRNLPGTGGRYHSAELVRALEPVLAHIRRDFAFDLIAAEFFFPDGPAAIELGRRFGVPVSIKARGSDIHRWGNAPAVAEQIREAGCAADGLQAVSQAIRRDMIALGMPGNRIEAMVNGVDQARFTPRDRGQAKAALGVAGPLVVSVGAVIPIKGHDIAIDAVARLPGVHLWIAGQGPEQARLQSRIDRLGVAGRVRLLGATPHDGIPALLAAADVMALASEREGMANAWLEALASGTPIVVPDVGGARQLLGDSPVGRIVPRTPQAFAEAIAALIADPPPQDACRAHIEPFTWPANAACLHAHYLRLVAARAGEAALLA